MRASEARNTKIVDERSEAPRDGHKRGIRLWKRSGVRFERAVLGSFCVMKKLSGRYHRWLLARARYERWKESTRFRKSVRLRIFNYSSYVKVSAGRSFDLEENLDATLALLDLVRSIVFRRNQRALIMMGNTEIVSPEAALILAAEIQRCLYHRPGAINGSNPKNAAARGMLSDIGFYSLLGFRRPSRSKADAAVTYIRMQSDTVDNASPWHADTLQKAVFGHIEQPDSFTRELIRGMSEALLNVRDHAYPPELMESVDWPVLPNGRWWIAGYRDPAKREVVFMALDHGVGIPKTFPARRYRDIALSAVAAIGRTLGDPAATIDHRLLHAAMQFGETRTDKSGRGNGLYEFRRLIELLGGRCSLTVLSGQAKYLYNSDGEEFCGPIPRFFVGTLVVWRLIDCEAVSWPEQK